MMSEVVRMRKKRWKSEELMELYKDMVTMLGGMNKFEKWVRSVTRDEVYKRWKKVEDRINKRDEHPRCKKCGKYLIVSWGDAIQHNEPMYCRCNRRDDE
jgi:hypothetical protein